MAALKLALNQSRRHCSSLSTLKLFYFSFSQFPGIQRLTPPISSNLGFHQCISSLSLGLGSQFAPFSSSSDSDPQLKLEPEAPEKPPRVSPTLKPVSYPVKPKDHAHEEVEEAPKTTSRRSREPRHFVSQSFEPESESKAEQDAETEARRWTREDIRYVKNVPNISPISYPTKVAPLPEDRSSADDGVEREGDGKEEPRRDRAEEEQEKEDTLIFESKGRKIDAETRIRRVLRVEEEKVPFPTLIKVEKNKPATPMELQEAIREVKANARQKFVETVEAHVVLGVDPRRGDQMVRGAITLPHGTGKTVRVAVFADGAAADEARAAGADVVGADELIEEIKNGGGKLNFDKCIATPSFMPRLGKIARILGPRGMMPNPKLGSVTSDVATAVQAAKRGRVDFKIDKTAIVHAGLGKPQNMRGT
ncbi:uncharacterized protein LOC18425641 isoform X2 [Amborella trichopoda]|uniref:uncharacterized protein LOC18425641 isoform X2 n=1 Tax=Amborella trichopoda TaxID=13333 RepID=UPI0005D4634B|nr:uncharacterized protein LOC18425641 isoform X2 [Amborella trichopoda]|eukprot:XP_011629371.1 uncharacterized protein LOC18425641 isoform X2 [Amborella trichopoda]